MKLTLPKTMTGLVAAGCVLVALPLLAALLVAAAALQRMSHQTAALLDDGLMVAQLGTQLRDQLNNLERGARQYLVLREPSLMQLSDRRWSSAGELIRELRARPLEGAVAMNASRLAEGFGNADAAWHGAAGDTEAMLAAAEELHALLPDADALILESQEQVRSRTEKLQADTQRARHHMLLWALSLIPLGALLAWAFSRVVTRPVKQMFRAIAALGHGRYEPAMLVGFPRELRRLGEQIDWLRRRLARLEEDKDRFLRQVSHELKTPLASLREGTELLREGALGELTRRQLEVAGILADSTVELETLIDNLLAYAEWRAERQQSHKIWFDAQALIEEVLSVNRLRLLRRGLRVELDVRQESLLGLRSQMRVALDNLITNAIKHSPPDTVIEIGVGLVGGSFELSVRDHGRGVPDAERDNIFEPFVRGTEVEEEGIRGTGIGLSIVRETVLAQGGAVAVDDAAPGARFRMRWPAPVDA